jgi:probable HAF family extracellular repeat protein
MVVENEVYTQEEEKMKNKSILLSTALLIFISGTGFAASFQGLGDLPGGQFSSKAYGISADGSVVVGYGHSSSGIEAFRWTSATGFTGLGDLPGGEFVSLALAVFANGSVVVGTSYSSSSDYDAFYWTAAGGIQSLKDILTNCGPDLTGWTLRRATGVSADGLTIVGYGINPQGDTEAWIAIIPEPATILLFSLGGLALMKKRR